MTDIFPEIFVGTGGEAGIDNLDDLMAAFPKEARRAADSALSSEGYRLKEILQRAISSGGPEGHKWEKLSPYYTRLTKTGQAKWRRLSSKTQNRRRYTPPKAAPEKSPLLKFKGGVRYVVEKDMDLVRVGFVNPSAGLAKMLAMHETGFKTTVTRKMQKFFFGMGLPLVADEIESPARPLIGPVFESEETTIGENLERKFFANLDRYWDEGATS